MLHGPPGATAQAVHQSFQGLSPCSGRACESVEGAVERSAVQSGGSLQSCMSPSSPIASQGQRTTHSSHCAISFAVDGCLKTYELLCRSSRAKIVGAMSRQAVQSRQRISV